MSGDDASDRAARAYAQWHIGDPSWWDALKAAAESPDETLAVLEADGMDVDAEGYR
jgi:hypothetical protein